MRKTIALMLLLATALTAAAQSFEKGQTEIVAGVLFSVFGNNSSAPIVTKNLFPPVFIGADYGLSKHFSLGIRGSLAKQRRITKPMNGIGQPDTLNRTVWSVGVVPLYHLRIATRVDFFAGGGLYTDGYGIGPDLLIGARYRVDDHVGIYLEAHPVSFGAGISYRFLSKNGE